MNMETKKIYVRPACEAINMDVCVLDAYSANTDGETDNDDEEDLIGGAPGYHGPIDDTPVSDED